MTFPRATFLPARGAEGRMSGRVHRFVFRPVWPERGKKSGHQIQNFERDDAG